MSFSTSGHTIDFSKLEIVTDDRFFIDKNETKINPDGLFSEQIFGPIKNFKCACGKYSIKSLYYKQRCPDCNVLCENSDIRYTTFAKIQLDFPFISHNGMKIIKKLFTKKTNHILNNKRSDISLTTQNYLTFKNNKFKILNNNDIADNMNYININITGIYSLYLSVISLDQLLNNEHSRELLNCFSKELLVIPPKCRNTVKLSNNKLIVSEIDKLYQSIIRSKKYERLDKNFLNNLKNFENMARDNAYNNIEIFNNIDIKTYDKVSGRIQNLIDTIYNLVTTNLSGKEGLIRKNFIGKSIDFSGRSVITPNTKLKTYEISLPKEMFLKLYFLEYLKFLRNIKQAPTHGIKTIIKGSNNINLNINYFHEFIDYFFNNKDGKVRERDKILLFNRQPTLWRWGLSAVKVVGVNDDKVIETSPNVLSPYGGDYDGDTMAVYKMHDNNSMLELENNAFLANFTKFDHNENFLHKLDNELKYCFKLMLVDIDNKKQKAKLHINELQELPESFELYNRLYDKVYIESEKNSFNYAICLINKWVKNKSIVINHEHFNDITIVNKCIEENVNFRPRDYHDLYNSVTQKMFWLLNCNTKEVITMPFNESLEILKSNKERNKLIEKLPENAYIGNYIYQVIVENTINSIPKNYKLFKVTESRFKKEQFARSIIGVGYVADNNNMVSNVGITKNLFQGLTEEEFFSTTYGTRKGLIDKEKSVPKSGTLERDMVYNLSSIEIEEEDCKTNYGLKIKIENYQHGKNLVDRYFNKDDDWVLFTEDMINENIGNTLLFRSPITCFTGGFKICRKCFGNHDLITPYIGVITGQSVNERLTQLSMSSFHTSGSAVLNVNKKAKEYIKNNIVDIKNKEDEIEIKFKEKPDKEITEIFEEIPGYKYFLNNYAFFEKIKEKIPNEDISAVITKINKCLLTENDKIVPISQRYNDFVKYILSKENIYSVFFEIILCNLYANENDKIYRYLLRDNEPIDIVKKYNINSVNKIISPTLSLVYRPNEDSINKFYNFETKIEKLSIFERIFMGVL